MSEKVVIGYWNIRGLVQPIKYLLEYAQVPYEDKQYILTDAGPSEEWKTEKATRTDLTFPNLPYMLDGDIRITQSMAILRYLARKHNLMGFNWDKATEDQKALVDMLEQQTADLRMSYINYALSSAFVEFLFPEGYPESLPRQLAPMSKMLSSTGGNYLFGDELSYVDFILFEVLEVFRMINENCLDETLSAYYDRIRNEPNIKAFMESDRFIKWPVLGPFAKVWGWKK